MNNIWMIVKDTGYKHTSMIDLIDYFMHRLKYKSSYEMTISTSSIQESEHIPSGHSLQEHYDDPVPSLYERLCDKNSMCRFRNILHLEAS